MIAEVVSYYYSRRCPIRLAGGGGIRSDSDSDFDSDSESKSSLMLVLSWLDAADMNDELYAQQLGVVSLSWCADERRGDDPIMPKMKFHFPLCTRMLSCT